MASNKMDLKRLGGGMGIDRQTESQSSQEAASIIELGSSFLVIERIYESGRPKLMRIAWFATATPDSRFSILKATNTTTTPTRTC